MKFKTPTCAVFIISVVIFACLSVVVKTGNAQSFNDMMYGKVGLTINPQLTTLMIIISDLGRWFVYLPIAVLFIIMPRLRLKIGIPVALTLTSSAILNIILKYLFVVDRPDIHRLISESGYGFPSGHAMNGTVFIGMCAFLFIKYTRRRPLKLIVPTVSFVFMLLMGYSRIYLGVHTTTDIIGGYSAGIAVLASGIFAFYDNPAFLDHIASTVEGKTPRGANNPNAG